MTLNLIVRTENGIISNYDTYQNEETEIKEFQKLLKENREQECYFDPIDRNYFSYINRYGIPVVYNLLLNIGEEL